MPNAKTLARAVRTRTLPMIVAPVAAGAALAYQRGFDFAWGWFALTIAGAVALQFGSNALGDVADARSGADKLARVDRGAIATDPGLIETRQMSQRATLILAAALYGAAFVIGVVLAIARGWLVLPLGAAGGLLAWQYWWPPVRYGYRGFGALGTFAAFGVLAVVGAYYVQAQRFDAVAIAVAIVPGMFMSVVLFTHDLLHFRSDKAAGKLTPAARWGDEVGLIVIGAWITLTYVVLTLEVAFKVFPVWTLAAVVTAIPVAGSWARGFRDSIVQNCLNLLGATLGAAVLTTMAIGLSLLFWR
ncbi:MAG TPA: prenyltransferase [Actinomycetota bacterium]|nr:prenyltransferase [Actinomycetota bacterium]